MSTSAICVLGMHRSGTSLVTRLIELLGVGLGARAALMEPDRGNETGYWEHAAITRLNDQILAAFGGSWLDPPALPAGWTGSRELEPLHRRAREVISEAFADAPLFGWKDPRTSITLPFWREVVPGLRCVVCVRNPVGVAASLARRDVIEPGDSHRAWLDYNATLLVATADLPRLFVSPDRLLGDPDRELARLAAFVGLPEAASDPVVRAAANAFIDRELWHAEGAESRTAGHVPAAIERLYGALAIAAAQPVGAEVPRIALSIDDLSRILSESAADLRAARTPRRALAEAQSEIAYLRERVRLAEEAHRQTAAYAEQSDELSAALETELTALRRRASLRLADAMVPQGSRRAAAYRLLAARAGAQRRSPPQIGVTGSPTPTRPVDTTSPTTPSGSGSVVSMSPL